VNPGRARQTESALAANFSHDEEAERILRRTMSSEVGVIRDEHSLKKALGTIGMLEERANGDRRLLNMLTTAKLITAAALTRKESRGAHFRSDCPTADQRLARRSFITLTEAETIAVEATKSAEPPQRLAALRA
jgi:L-aspartate oxidase